MIFVLRAAWLRILFLAFTVVRFSGVSLGAHPSLTRELRSVLSALPHAQTVAGVCIIDLESAETVFAQRADQPLIPASSLKVLTMAAALTELGPNFSFETILATDGEHLHVIGDGDPAFGDEKLCRSRGESITSAFEKWADVLERIGLTSVVGDLVVDESIFDGQWVHPSWEASDLGKWYAAPVSGLNFNGNCVDITIRPAGQVDAPVLVSVQPQTELVRVLNRCVSGARGTPLLHHAAGTYDYKITGRCSKLWAFGSVAFPDPGMLFADSLRVVFANRGITIAGEIRRTQVRSANGSLPDRLNVVATHRTPIADVLRRAGKDSQNLFAESLLKRSGYAWAQRIGAPKPQGTWETGAHALVEMVRRAGIDTTGLNVADGSGLSRSNACTARQVAQVLAWSFKQPWGPLLHDSLAAAGRDGSLHKRLRDSPGRVFAKTGTMRGVRTLAGYVDSQFGPRFAFAVFFNGYRGPSTPYKEIQDRLCRILIGASEPSEAGSR